MGESIIITICCLLLIGYVFDITAAKSKIPSIILLLLMGFILNQVFIFIGFSLPELDPILPILGTLGLILIVLEGALELDFNKDKLKMIGTSSLMALLNILLLSTGIAYIMYYYGDHDYKTYLINALPLCIISSAIAIPSAKSLTSDNKEFVTYESSLSDIFGVLIFNFLTLNNDINTQSVISFSGQFILMLVLSLLATIILYLFIANIRHHVKFLPIILAVILIYELAKFFHLPALIFILLFGIILHNLDQFDSFDIIKKIKPKSIEKEVHKFAEITMEFSFLIRALFFILFGFLIEFNDIVNTATLPLAILITVLVFSVRAIYLFIIRKPLMPLLFLAPRGLITILLFLSIPSKVKTPLVNNALLIQVILLCAVVMMIGLMNAKVPRHTDLAESLPQSSHGHEIDSQIVETK